MVQTDNVRDFYINNHEELKKFFIYKTGIRDPELIKDHMQDFYHKLESSKSLETYDKKLGSFNTYVLNYLCWMLPIAAKKNMHVKYEILSHIKLDKDNCRFKNIFSYVSASEDNSYLSIDGNCSSVSLNLNDEANVEFKDYMDKFKDYIKKTENKLTSSRMLEVIDLKIMGYKASHIARILRFTDMTISLLNKRLKEKYAVWEEKVQKEVA